MSNNKWSPNVGDRVKYNAPYAVEGVVGAGTVLSLHEDRAWVKFDSHIIPLSPKINYLKAA